MADLVVIETRRNDCQQSVVDLLENVLEDAKKGNVIAAALAIVMPGGAIGTGTSDSEDAAALLGAISLLQARIIAGLEAE